jgi:hypothetical protein
MTTPTLASEKLEFSKIAAADYSTKGFCRGPVVLPKELIKRTRVAVDALRRREYETGEAPLDAGHPDDPPTKLRKIDQPQVANRTILEALTYPELGRQVAKITGANFLQIWAVQLLHKPPGGDTQGAVGWHQDYFYWQNWWTPESEVFTAWLALTDVREESGPMHFVPGSHKWGLCEGSNFWKEHDREGLTLPAGANWREESGTLPAGAFSLHHRLTFHGSAPNASEAARYSFAIHLRAQNSAPTPSTEPDFAGYDYVAHLDDPIRCPVIYRA